MADERVNTIELTDEELNMLNQVVRKHQVNTNTEELLLVQLGKVSSPLLSTALKVITAFEKRQAEKAEETKQAPVQE